MAEAFRRILSSPRCLQARFQQTLSSAYIFHPNIQTIEADKQMFLWTKTIQVDNPPNVFSNLMTQVDLEPMNHVMERTILVSRLYEKREIKRKSKKKPKDVTRGTHENFPSTLLQNQFKNVMGFAINYPQLRNLNPAFEAQVSASWKVKDEMISVHGRPGTYLNSKKPMPLFYDSDVVQASKDTVPSVMEPAWLFRDLNKYLIRETASTGLLAEKSFFPHFHTLLVIDNGEYIPPPSRGLSEIQILQKGLLFTFCRLLAQAVAKHGNEILGNVLPEPECAQSIMTDGNRFSFLWYQLNTLDMDDLENGVKNLVCIERPGEMFSTIEEQTKNKHSLVDFDKDILRMYLTMLLLS